jgi:hypothetical protein
MKILTGNILAGFAVSDHKFQGVTTLNQSQAYGLLRPSVIDRQSKGLSADELEAHVMHSMTNRTFDKARLDNAKDYSGYIEATEVHGRPGGTPAITLYYPGELKLAEGGIVIPYGAKLVAIDGETQTEARHMLRDRCPETGDNPIAVTLYHGVSAEVAQQILHDYNVKGLPWTETKAARFNRTGALSAAVEGAIKGAHVSMDKVNVRGGKANKRTIVALHQLVTLFAAYQLNGVSAQGTVGSGHLKRLNTETAASVPASCVHDVASILTKANDNPAIGSAPALVWQVAGLLLSRNVKVASINWERGASAYAETRMAGRGGRRLPIADRIAVIAKAMQS